MGFDAEKAIWLNVAEGYYFFYYINKFITKLYLNMYLINATDEPKKEDKVMQKYTLARFLKGKSAFQRQYDLSS